MELIVSGGRADGLSTAAWVKQAVAATAHVLKRLMQHDWHKVVVGVEFQCATPNLQALVVFIYDTSIHPSCSGLAAVGIFVSDSRCLDILHEKCISQPDCTAPTFSVSVWCFYVPIIMKVS